MSTCKTGIYRTRRRRSRIDEGALISINKCPDLGLETSDQYRDSIEKEVTIAGLCNAVGWFWSGCFDGKKDVTSSAKFRAIPQSTQVQESVAWACRSWELVKITPAEAGISSGYQKNLARGEYCKLDNALAAVTGTSQAAIADTSEVLAQEDHYQLTEEFILQPRSNCPSFDSLQRTRIRLGVKTGKTLDC